MGEIFSAMLSVEWWVAFAAIIAIDLVLAGDNAIVIALAARNLPPALRRRAVIWGTAGAVAVRVAGVFAVTLLLGIPGLRLAGGVILLWIAWRLLKEPPQGEKQHGGEVAAAASFWAAMRAIIIADAAMGLDNVLAIAAAARGDWLLVVLGLLISIPLVVFGSLIILRWMNKYPILVALGGGLLAGVAVRLMLDDAWLADILAWSAVAEWLLVAAVFAAATMLGARMQGRDARAP